LYIPEADLERLIRTLSEARARSTELAASISARLGTDHPLAELANAASSRIENMLRELQTSAAERSPSGGLAELRGALETDVQPLAPRSDHPVTPPAPAVGAEVASIGATAGLDSEHWLSMFVNDLVAQLRTSGGITFEVAERLLQQRKDDFLRNFLIARRMYRTYPRLFPEIQQDAGSPEHEISQ
jgi:3-oxoacyl-ACP reductase-like protein